MLRGVGDPVDVHEVDDALMLESIARLREFAASRASTGAARREVERSAN